MTIYKGTLAMFKLVKGDWPRETFTYSEQDADTTKTLYELWNATQRRAWDGWGRPPEYDWAWDLEGDDDADDD